MMIRCRAPPAMSAPILAGADGTTLIDDSRPRRFADGPVKGAAACPRYTPARIAASLVRPRSRVLSCLRFHPASTEDHGNGRPAI